MKHSVPKRLKKALDKKNACFVLITCQAPAEDGRMEVEMIYEGDETLAAYLLMGAQDFIGEKCRSVQACLKEEKVFYLEN